MRAIYPTSASDKTKILSVIDYFDEMFPNFDCFVSSYSIDGEKDNLGIIEKLSEDLSEPLSDDLLLDAEDLFTTLHGASQPWEQSQVGYIDLENDRYEENLHPLDEIEKAYDDFFRALYKEANKRG